MDLAATSNVVTTWGWWGYWSYYSYTQADGYANVLLGHGDGAFDAPQATWVSNNYSSTDDLGDLANGDFNGDGKLDVVTYDFSSAGPALLLGKGDGTFEAAFRYGVGVGPDAVAVGNFNGDTSPDVAVASYAANVSVLSVLLNDADWRTLAVSGLPASAT